MGPMDSWLEASVVRRSEDATPSRGKSLECNKNCKVTIDNDYNYLINFEMKRMILAIYTPFIGFLMPYVYTIICKIESGKANIYLQDPKDFQIGRFYEFFLTIPLICFVIVLVTAISFLIAYIYTNDKKDIKKHLIIYFSLLIILFIIHHYDPGKVFGWFVD